MALSMDLSLARRLERAEAAVGAAFIPVRQRLAPGVGATWRDFAGTYAIFDGVDSSFTRSLGLGLFAPATPELLAEVDAFFIHRGAIAAHEVSPLAGISTFALLAECGHLPVDLTTMLVRDLDEDVPPPEVRDLRARVAGPDDHARWIEAAVAGWADVPDQVARIRTVAETALANPAMVHFVVERGDAIIGTGSMGVEDGVAFLAGASTIPAARGAGAQAALLAARLDEARRRGCALAMMTATPGSTSQRNAERRGFRVAYTRTAWGRPREGGAR